MRFKVPLRLQWLMLRIRNYFRISDTPEQLKKVADDPRLLPEYQRQVEFLRGHGIEEPYDCFQCREFDIEIDRCCTKYMELYCGGKRGDRMCPGFDPPEKGKFEFAFCSLDDLVTPS